MTAFALVRGAVRGSQKTWRIYRRHHNWVMQPTIDVVQWSDDVLELRWVVMR